MSVECQVHVKSQSELDIGGRETCEDMNSRTLIFISETLTTCVGTGTLTQPVQWQSEKRKSWISQTDIDTEDIWRSFGYKTNKTFARGLLTHEISHDFKVPTWRY